LGLFNPSLKWTFRFWRKKGQKLFLSINNRERLLPKFKDQNKHGLFPIPKLELDINKNLTQNLGW